MKDFKTSDVDEVVLGLWRLLVNELQPNGVSAGFELRGCPLEGKAPPSVVLIDNRHDLAIDRHLGTAGVVELEAAPADRAAFERNLGGCAQGVGEVQSSIVVPARTKPDGAGGNAPSGGRVKV